MRDVAIDMTGQVFGRLTVVRRAPKEPRFLKKAAWICICSCGQERVVVGSSLRNGLTKSCGCFHDERCRERRTTHAACGTREYRSWCAAKNRCYNQNQRSYKDYGARGIVMCNQWLRDFPAFRAYMGPCPPGYTIDRIHNDGNYEPGNCRWATTQTQANNCRTNRFLEYQGQRHTVAEWARLIGMSGDTLKRRIALGWTPERAFTEPLRG